MDKKLTEVFTAMELQCIWFLLCREEMKHPSEFLTELKKKWADHLDKEMFGE